MEYLTLSGKKPQFSGAITFDRLAPTTDTLKTSHNNQEETIAAHIDKTCDPELEKDFSRAYLKLIQKMYTDQVFQGSLLVPEQEINKISDRT